MKPLRLHGAAEREIDGALGWYEARSPSVAARFAAAVSTYLELIDLGLAPLHRIPPPHDRLGARRLLIRGFPYQIVVFESRSKRIVLAVSHQSRRPGHWADRIEA